ncbi:kinase-like protein [Basidiobolus meristosporus CBS 931.73]|uniref:Kinase-like protein n=1 Tax=Basidiobolus meristosporus CBS 931.73 TaxID=1314790 RepID=A0A1Y1XX08_9FUNG|nr:kinase-like protein [Basidiobolus meristosporus CBS 931.73]|eukprot:ORX90026.1 kinase-like protein [Basidiobolus meristosporus CBS 931.73]
MPSRSPVKIVEIPCLDNAVYTFSQPFQFPTHEPSPKFLPLSKPSSTLSLDNYSTVTSCSSIHSSSSDHSEHEEFAIDVAKVPSRFVFTDINPTPAKPNRKSRFAFISQLKNIFPQKKKALPLVEALEKRRGPLLKDNYGPFEKVIGTGNGGNVQLTNSESNGQKYAVKTFRKRFSSESETRYYEWLSNEIFLAASIKHPNIVDVQDVILEDGEIHQVMPYYPSDLFGIVSSGEISAELAGKYFIQLLRGLFYLHSRGFGHRDLKLENICVDGSGDAKIIDFGCAVVFKTFGYDPKLVEDVCGSDPYIAPEIFTGRPYDVRKSDIWSAAIVYISMILKRHPWDVALSNDKSYKLYLEHRKVDRFFNKIPSGAATILKKMLEPNPSLRATMEDILADEWIQSLDAKH